MQKLIDIKVDWKNFFKSLFLVSKTGDTVIEEIKKSQELTAEEKRELIDSIRNRIEKIEEETEKNIENRNNTKNNFNESIEVESKVTYNKENTQQTHEQDLDLTK